MSTKKGLVRVFITRATVGAGAGCVTGVEDVDALDGAIGWVLSADSPHPPTSSSRVIKVSRMERLFLPISEQPLDESAIIFRVYGAYLLSQAAASFQGIRRRGWFCYVSVEDSISTDSASNEDHFVSIP